jgi:hypothetical protein
MAMMVDRDDLWLCDDCLFYAVNDDLSGIDYHYSGEEADKRVKEVKKGVHSLGRNLVPDFDSETGEGIEEFSSHRCDACGTRLAGSRHRFATLRALTRVEERELSEMKTLLKDAGYDPDYAIDLLSEGMGLYELEGRLAHKPGSVGSLDYTHEIERGARRARRYRVPGKR